MLCLSLSGTTFHGRYPLSGESGFKVHFFFGGVLSMARLYQNKTSKENRKEQPMELLILKLPDAQRNLFFYVFAS